MTNETLQRLLAVSHQVAADVSKALPVPTPMTAQAAYYQAAIREACEWLRAGGNGRALEVLENALQRK